MTAIDAHTAREALQAIVDLIEPELLPEQEPGEYTVKEIADQLGIHPNQAKPLLDAQVQAGQLTARPVRAEGRRAQAYRKVTG